MIKLDKNIPIPVASKKTGPRKYPFAEMEIGDSFFIEATSIQQIARKRSTLCVSAKRMGDNYKITIKRVIGGIRCWRVQ